MLKRIKLFVLKGKDLITKYRCFHKPTVEDLRRSLIALREFLHFNNVTELAMPEIAAGLDQVPLNLLIEMLNQIFQRTPVTIYMYHI